MHRFHRLSPKLLITLVVLTTVSCTSSSIRFSEEPQTSFQLAEDTMSVAQTAVPDEVATDTIYADSSLLEYSYVDEELQYQLDLAEENYIMGYAATLDSSWLEAQFYFESALEILAGLDLDPEEPTVAAELYNRLINEVISDYKRTVLHIATLPGESSPSAVIARYEELDSLVNGEQFVAEPPEPDTVVFDIPITWNQRVENCINYFQNASRKPMEAALKRSGKYLPMMEKIIAEEGLPHDLVYLPLIESGFKTTAYSWAHAVGQWQFISSTGRIYGLHRSWWYDERRDFEKSTRAAARHLKDLYAKTDDWYLSLLGYVAGVGNVNKLIRRNNTRDYFEMQIRNRDMRNYVPLYLAALIIAKQPEQYGFHIEYDDPIVFDTVTVGRCLALEDIAKAVGCSQSELKELNPELLRKYTPPDKKSYTLRIPLKKRGSFWAAYPKMKSPKETSWVQHKVRKGETVSGIARKYGVSQWAVIDANGMRRPYRISIGQKVIVPVPLDGSGTQYSSKRESRDYNLTSGAYVVKRGDTLWDLARAFGTTTKALRQLNRIARNGRIYVGQKLKIPGGATGSTMASTGGSSTYSGSTFTYSVRKGDNLWDLAEKHGTTVSTLRKLNGLNRSSKLAVGQKLKIPGSVKSSSGNQYTYTVRKGDNLWKLANRNGTTISKLRRMNSLPKGATLKIGQKLKIPGSGKVSKGSDYYIVRRGDTLSSIAKRHGLNMNTLMAWNSISHPDRLSVGRKLRVSTD